MSKDADPQQRLWLAFGYGGKRASEKTWRYWAKPDSKSEWIISAPNGYAEFEQKGRTVFYKGKEILTAETQWRATWGALAHFYEKVAPALPPPPLS